jgi:ribosomal protein S18 acetylase RimI-like enzyme
LPLDPASYDYNPLSLHGQRETVLSRFSPNQVEGKVIRVGPLDANRLIELVRAFHGESGHAVGPEQSEGIRQVCADPTLGRAWVLTVQDKNVGYALAYFRHSIDHAGRIAVLDDIWVVADRRGQGLGTHLLKAVCADLQAMGARAVLLEVDPANEVAIALYSRFGFTKTGTAVYAKNLAQR